MYLEEPYYHESECFECLEMKNKIHNLKYWVKYLIEMLYCKDPVEMLDIEHCLEEICAECDLKIPEEAIQIKKKPLHPLQKEFDVEGWKKWNAEYLKKLTA